MPRTLHGRMRGSLKILLADLVIAEKTDPEAVLAWQHGSNAMSFREKGFKALGQLLKDIQRSPEFQGRFSRTYLEERVRESVSRHFDGIPQNIGKAATAIVDELLLLPRTQLRSYLVNVPIFGLEIFPDEMTVRVGDVEFYTLADDEKSRWMSFADMNLLRRDDLKPPGGSDTWAKVELEAVDADGHYLEEKCAAKTKQAMSVLLLFLPAYRSGDIHEREYQILLPQFSIWRGFEPDEKCYVYETKDNQNYEARSSLAIHRAPSGFFVNQNVMDEYAKHGFDRVSSLLRSPTTELQKTIYQSLRLFWTAYTSSDFAISYLNYVAMLEMLVMMPNERSTFRDMPLRISWILNDTAKTEKRLRLADAIMRLYSNRSMVAHGRTLEPEDISEDLLILRIAAFELVTKLAQCDNYTTQEDVKNWVNVKTMGGSERFDSKLGLPS